MDFSELDRAIELLGAGRVVEALAPLISEPRRLRIERALAARLDSLRVAVERPEDPYNAAAIVRSAEALGALHVHVVAAPARALHARKTTQGSYHWLHTYHHGELDELQACLRAAGARLYGAEVAGSYALEELPVDAPLCLLFGNEGTGLSERARAVCDLTFRIPMYGMSESLNLSVSAALALYSVAKRRRALLGSEGDLGGELLLRERARYYARCVDARMLRAL